jgi:lysophospholipase L1-like esterase
MPSQRHRHLSSAGFSRTLPCALLLACLFAFVPLATAAAPPDHWVGTWGASPVMAMNPDGNLLAGDTTLREIVHISLGGSTARIVLSNEFGIDPLTIGAAQIALSTGDGSIDKASAAVIAFSDRPSVTIPPGALVVSDPIAIKLAPFADVAVSLYVADQPIHQLSIHNFADQTSYTATGNVATAATLDSPKTIASWPILKNLDVKVGSDAAAIVTFGDSITDGALSTRNANARWPDVLARRLQANKKTADLGVINQGIGGNRVLHDVSGPSALARFDRDVLAQSGVKYLIILESINDIGHAADPDPSKRYDVITADDLIFGLGQLAERAHTHGIKVYGATLTPYVGAKYASPEGEAIREAVNTWVRTTKQLDGFIDFDKATQDPANPTVYLPANDSGDHLHPKDAGYKAMGESIDLKLFESK